MKKTKIILMTALLLCVSLTGCQQMNQQRAKYVRDREQDYLTSTVMAPMQVPADLTYLKGQEHYSFPDVKPGNLHPVSVVPPGFGELSQS